MYICIILCYNYYNAFLFIILRMFKKTELMCMRTGIWASIDTQSIGRIDRSMKQTAHHIKLLWGVISVKISLASQLYFSSCACALEGGGGKEKVYPLFQNTCPLSHDIVLYPISQEVCP